MIKRMLVMIVSVTVILGGIIGFKVVMAEGSKKFLATQSAPPQTVSTTKAEKKDWRQEIKAVGTLRAVNGADISSEVSGIVDCISFESGGEVEQGAILIHLRDDDAVAQLRALDAAAELARITLDRDLKQLKAHAVSQATVDNDTAALNSARAQADAQRAQVEKRTIRAPFNGHLGLRQVDLGQFLDAGKPIVTLQQMDPIYVDFNLPEKNLPTISVGQKVVASVDALSGEAFEGEISAVNSKIDESTRNVQVRATFKNADHRLLPGMFAHVSITTGDPQSYITLPQTSITYNPYGNTVFIVAKDEKGGLTAKQTFVTLGSTRGDQVAIESGLEDGTEVVTAGQLKLRNGTPLIVDNAVQPKNDEDPKPEEK